MEATQRRQDGRETTLAAIVQARAVTSGDRPALIGVNETMSYGGLAARANRYARWALREGLAAGDIVGLLMPNRPEYVAIWLGLTQIGCVVALLNTSLMPDALAHSLRSAGAGLVIVDATLMDRAGAAMGQSPATMSWWMHGASGSDLPRIDVALEKISGAALEPEEQRPPARDAPALLIYTSGTTGLPKAAHVRHARVLEWSDWFAGMMDAQADDRLFDCLPLYHSVGGVVAIGSMLVAGGAVIIRERFSASRFWDDVIGNNCTIVQYIGELCRYLLRSGAVPCDGQAHNVRLFCGNGLRGDVWEDFQRTCRIPRILEFYAATEGNVSLYNCEGRPGAIGRVPRILEHRFPVTLVRSDIDTGEPLRDSAGRCIACGPDEAGEAIGRIDGAARRFDGYTDAAASARRILHDVFAPGDRWFRTGDLMRRDAAGFFYFVDRLGDTFRWKGENVSTADVASVLAACPNVADAVVYGVAVPGTEGKAGMAALAVDAAFSLTALQAHMTAKLPGYARPLFVRLCAAIETTETFKLKKAALARDSFSEAGADPVWFFDSADGGFVPCDAALRARLATGMARL